ncbi:MAG: WYL domain-containing protein, partial [Actinobacteria bacterium]|nr:WYL domain-containing protein [Actinomycetota bacterium]
MPRPKQELGARLRRVLAMVPWLLVQGESTVAAVATRFGMTEDEVIRELNLVMCCGVPPYGGGDLITIFLDEDGSISAWPGPYLARPMQLTAAEGFTVLAAGRALLAVPGAEADGALAGAMAKLERALGDEGRLEVELDAPVFLSVVREAVEQRQRLRITYYSAWRDDLTERVIEPWTVYANDGHWYVDALDGDLGEERRFRVDRIQAAEQTGDTFEPPDA